MITFLKHWGITSDLGFRVTKWELVPRFQMADRKLKEHQGQGGKPLLGRLEALLQPPGNENENGRIHWFDRLRRRPINMPLRSQFVTLKRGQHLKYRPYAFTEHGVLMLSSALNSERAIQVNIEIMRAFVRLRQMLASHIQLARKLERLEKKYDSQFKVVFDALRQLMIKPEPKRHPIGFRPGEPEREK